MYSPAFRKPRASHTPIIVAPRAGAWIEIKIGELIRLMAEAVEKSHQLTGQPLPPTEQ
jgi:hypothetical protein